MSEIINNESKSLCMCPNCREERGEITKKLTFLCELPSKLVAELQAVEKVAIEVRNKGPLYALINIEETAKVIEQIESVEEKVHKYVVENTNYEKDPTIIAYRFANKEKSVIEAIRYFDAKTCEPLTVKELEDAAKANEDSNESEESETTVDR